MKIFPIDPTPYCYVYIGIVFIFPWCVFSFFVIKTFIYSLKIHPEFSLIFGLNKYKEFQKAVDTDIYLKDYYQKVKRWLKITIILWVIGFTILGVTLYLLDVNNLLINHSKGIYKLL